MIKYKGRSGKSYMAKKYLPIRLNEELIKKVTEKAKKAKRSRNQYIEILIENDCSKPS